jgi:hypothetical protein
MQTDENRRVCDGNHTRIRVSDVLGEDAPGPVWPPADAETQCLCGAALEYRRIVEMLIEHEGPEGPHPALTSTIKPERS